MGHTRRVRYAWRARSTTEMAVVAAPVGVTCQPFWAVVSFTGMEMKIRPSLDVGDVRCQARVGMATDLASLLT